MKVTIEIECNTAMDLLEQLAMIREKIRQEIRQKGIDPSQSPLPYNFVLENLNYSGWHELIVDGI